MQKTTTSASILLWSIFVSFTLMFLFLSFSAHLRQKIEGEINFWQTLSTLFQKSDFSGTGKVLFPSKSIQTNTSRFFSLQKDEKDEFRFTATQSVITNIRIQKWGPLSFVFWWFSGATYFWAPTSSGFIETELTFTGYLSSSYDQWILYIKNLWGYTQYEMTVNMDYLRSSDSVKLVREIAWEQKKEQIFFRKNFQEGDYRDFDYTKLNMDF